MRVRDIMSRRPITVGTQTSVGTAIRLLASHGVTALPVVDAGARIVGIVSEADLIPGRFQPDRSLRATSAAAGEGRGRSPDDRVEEVMTRPTVVAHPETDLEEVERTMTATGVKSLPVVDATDQVVGVVSRSDVVRALARDDESLQEDITDALCDAELSRFRLEVRNGVALLRIEDPLSRYEHVEVLDLVAATPGIKAVHAW